MTNIITIFFYLAAWAYLLHRMLRRERFSTNKIMLLIGLGLLAHASTLYTSMATEGGIQLGFFKVALLFFFVINLLVLVSSTKKPLHNLFVFLLPLSIVGLLVGQIFDSPLTKDNQLTPSLIAHILLSVLAYSLLTIASLQALLLAYQSRQLKRKHFHGIMGLMPPLQTMETLLFELVWAGFVFLSLSILTGVIFIDDIFAQKLSHKTVFSILSWGTYAVLLSGRHSLGWRGPSAIRWVLGGFAALMLAYFGSKFVLEVLLAGR
ncbi:MAG: ABC-type uncharacterized transport system permease subunit [Lentisphaeria bacterium]|jgi:ABC-type uncharacterized transport system permease subunit